MSNDEQPGGENVPHDAAAESSVEPGKKHGDPLLNEAEGRHGPADLPDTGAGTATSATA